MDDERLENKEKKKLRIEKKAKEEGKRNYEPILMWREERNNKRGRVLA